MFTLFEGFDKLAYLGFFLGTEISEHDFVVKADVLERGFFVIMNQKLGFHNFADALRVLGLFVSLHLKCAV